PSFCSWLLRYWELRVSHYLPTAISLLEDVKAAMRLSDFFAILHALGGSAVRHHNDVRAEHLELILVWRVGSILRAGSGSFIIGNHLLFVLRFALGTDSQQVVADNFVQLSGVAPGFPPLLVQRDQSLLNVIRYVLGLCADDQRHSDTQQGSHENALHR